MSATRTYPVGVEAAFDIVLPFPLDRLFAHWYVALPLVRRIEAQIAPRGTVGQTRTIRLADGGSMHEQLVAVARPHHFDDELSGLTGPIGLLLHTINGRWAFEPVGTRTRVRWIWDVQARSAVAERMLSLPARLWRGYAERALADLENVLRSA